MSDAQTALGGVTWDYGIARIEEADLQGMISLRGDMAALKPAVENVTGLPMPDQRTVLSGSDNAICWMSPDELLILCPYANVSKMLSALQAELADVHSLAVDVSDARAVFDLSGPSAREVLAKLAPVDLAPGLFEPGMIRRTRLAQVPAAFWMTGPEAFRIICFRSQSQYIFDVLKAAAQPGSDVRLF